MSSIKWFVYLNFKLGRHPYKVIRVLNNALKDIDFKPICKLVPLLGMLRMSSLSGTTFIYHTEPSIGSSTTSMACKMMQQLEDEQNEDEQHDQVCYICCSRL